jgi:hypothetical protein
MKARLLKLGAVLGIDAPILNIITARLWGLLARPISMVLIVSRLSSNEQGFYYAYTDLLSMAVFLELGLITIILQFAAHEMAGLRWDEERVVGEDPHHARLSDLLRKSLRWYTVVGVLAVALILPVGHWFLAHNPANAAEVNWQGPWILLAIVLAVSLSLTPVTAIIEGCGRVAEVTRVHMYEGMAMGIALWVGLLSGLKLYAVPCSSAAAVLVTCTWLFTTKRAFLGNLLGRAKGATVAWWREIVPLQWRFAVVWISGYFAYQLFTLAVFYTHDATLAGRVGMTLNLISVAGGVSLAWMQTKASPFGQMVAGRAWTLLDKIYERTLVQAMGVYVLGCLALMVAMLLLPRLPYEFATRISERLLDVPTALIFMAAAGCNQMVFCRSTFLRAHKAEPYYVLHLINGILVAAILFGLVKRVRLPFVALAYLLAACVPVLLVSGIIFRRFRNKYRAENLPAE